MLYDFYICHQGRNSLYTLERKPEGAPEIVDAVSPWEVPFAIDIGLDVPLVGRIDGLVRHRDSRKLWGLEWKTTGELSTRFLQSFTNSPQVIAYTLALRIFTGEKVEGFIVEGLRVSKTNAETQSISISVQDFKVDDFISWARFHGRNLLDCERIGNFPKFFSGCNPYPMFGSPGYICDYANLCDVPDWTALKSFYATGTDRPFILASSAESNLPHNGELPTVQVTVGGRERDVSEVEGIRPVAGEVETPRKDQHLPIDGEDVDASSAKWNPFSFGRE